MTCTVELPDDVREALQYCVTYTKSSLMFGEVENAKRHMQKAQDWLDSLDTAQPEDVLERSELERIMSGAIELMIEFRDVHGYDEERATAQAVLDMLEAIDLDTAEPEVDTMTRYRQLVTDAEQHDLQRGDTP